MTRVKDMELYSEEGIKYIRKKYGFHNTKSLGQNFLADKGVIDSIIEAASIDPEDLVIEIGPGLGVLTQREAELAKKVYAIELDRDLIPILNDLLKSYDNVEIIHGDILKTDVKALIEGAGCEKTRIVGNLPYYITTPIIMQLLEKKVGAESITIMLQKEVAERITAEPGGRTYGALSVAVQYYAEVVTVAQAPSHMFVPAPKVDSTVLRLDIRKNPAVEVKDEEFFFKVVKAAFGQRRKTLINSISGGGFNKDKVKEVFEKIGMEGNRRAETLSLEEFADLADGLME